mgnify:CR=1 FL=1
MSNLIDRYLIFRIRAKRDSDAFAEIYDKYVNAIYRFVFLKVPSTEDAQDITAEVFTKLLNVLNENQRVTYVRALLYKMARNLIADFYRKRQPTQSLLLHF